MLTNYFKTAWRNLVRNKFYSAINISGLAIGLAVGIMVLIWVQYEYSYDDFHGHAKNIYKINSHLGTGTSAQVWDGSPAPMAVFCKQLPEVLNTVRISNIDEHLLFSYQNKKFEESGLAFVDSTFFSMFNFKLLEGDAGRPFNDLNSIVLTSSQAKKYFGNNSAIGKILVTDQGNFTVSAVMEDFPGNSSIQYNMFLPMSLCAELFAASGGNGGWKTMDEDLGSFAFKTFVLLQTNADAGKTAHKLAEMYHAKKGDSGQDLFSLQSLKTIHLIGADGNKNALQKVRIFLIVAILILFIACINYVNLSTARSMLRAKEVSVRKIIGAEKYQLFVQFILESALLFLIASGLAFFIIYLLLPTYNNISGKQLIFSLYNTNVWLVIGSSVIGTLALAGVYPALLLSSFKPIQALKGKLSFGIRSTSFRKVLVVTQFAFSVGLIAITIIISIQLEYIRDKDLGFNKEHVFSFTLRDELKNHFNAVQDELLKQPGVLDVATSGDNIAGFTNTTGDTYWEGKEQGSIFLVHTNRVNENFIPLLNMKMVAGNNFTGSKADSVHFILNETAVRQAGIKDPVGKSFTLFNTKGTIVGVVKNFNYASLKQSVEPAVFSYSPVNSTIYIKTTGKEAAKAIAAAQKVWRAYSPDFPFSHSFLDDDFNKMYQSDQRMGILFNVFAIVGIIISCLGLFGLTAYTAQVKTKEIGIRKVLGASVASLAGLLTKEFLFLVSIGFVVASPIAWFAMYKWLQDFAYRINIRWWMFALAGASVIIIALLTVSFQAIKAAIANPVKSLRTE